MREHQMTVVISWQGDIDETVLPTWFRACLAEWRVTGAPVQMPLGVVHAHTRLLTDAELDAAKALVQADPGEWRQSLRTMRAITRNWYLKHSLDRLQTEEMDL